MAEDDLILGTADTVKAAREMAIKDIRRNQRIPEGYTYYQPKPLFPDEVRRS
jgi:hypothetical protein